MSNEFPDGVHWSDVSVMDDWIGLRGGLFFNLEKSWRGRKIIFTMKLDKGECEPIVIGSNDPKRFNTEKFRFVPPETQPTLDVLDIRATFKEAFEHLRKQYDGFLYLLEPEYYDLLVLGAMSTYFREVFYTYPYYDFYAREYNCGKTTAMKCLIWASFYGFLPLDPTGPVLFRAIDGCHSAVGLDELDNVIQDEAGRSNIIGLLNAAYQKGTPAYRIDMEKGGEVVPYDPFGLKAFTHTSPLPSSFTSRSIVFIMYRTPETKEQLRTPESFIEFRNMMYRLRLDNAPDVDSAYDYVLKNCNLLNRGRDRFAPILTMARLVGDDVYDRILNWANEYLGSETPASFDEVDRVLIELLNDIGGGRIMLSEFKKEWNKTLQERDLATKDYGSKKLASKLESFGFVKSEHRTGNKVHYEISKKKLDEWVRIYNINPEESKPVTNLTNFNNSEELDPEQEVLIPTPEPEKNESPSGQEREQERVIEVNEVSLKLTKMQKFLLEYSIGSEFNPSEEKKNNTNFTLWKAVADGYVEEIKVGGPYRLTAAGRKLIEGCK